MNIPSTYTEHDNMSKIEHPKTMRLLERHYKSDTRKYSFSIRSAHLWNSLDAEIRSTGNHQLFKRYLDNSVKDQKPVYFDQFLTELPISNKCLKQSSPPINGTIVNS